MVQQRKAADETAEMGEVSDAEARGVLDWLLAPSVFAGLRGGQRATWKPRVLAATALLWATSDLPTLHARFVQARKVIAKVFRWRR